MAVRDSMRESVTPHLLPDETVHAVIAAQTRSQFLMLAGVLPFIALNKYRILAVTSHRILVLDAGRVSAKKARSVVAELPRSTRLGPASGMVWYVIPVQGEKLRVHRQFFKDVAHADSVLTGV